MTMKMNVKRIEKRNENLTKREVIRRMYEKDRKNNGQFHDRTYSFSYVARRIGEDVESMLRFVEWMSNHQNVKYSIKGRNVVFG